MPKKSRAIGASKICHEVVVIAVPVPIPVSAPDWECTCDPDNGVCCEIASRLLRWMRTEFDNGVMTGDWIEFNRARTNYETHRIEAMKLCVTRKTKTE